MGTESSLLHIVFWKKDIARSPQLHRNKGNTDGNSRSPAQGICLVIVFSTWITTLIHSCTPEASEVNSACFISELSVCNLGHRFFFLFFFFNYPERRRRSPFKVFLPLFPIPFPPIQLHRQQLTMKQRINLPCVCVSMLPGGLAGSCISANRMWLRWSCAQSASVLA